LRAGKIIAKAKVIQNARSKMGTMAENHAQPAGPPAMDYAGHDKTHWMFRQFMKYTVAGAPLILALLACFRG
jgi:Bacterial aa3 type cytochrome c oxidase subunit IV